MKQLKKEFNKLSKKEKKLFLSKIIGYNNLQEKLKIGVTDEQYILWLEEFTNTYPVINEEDFLNYQYELSNEDYINIKKLHTLYELLEKYAYENNYSPMLKLTGNYYILKYNNTYFNVGVLQIDKYTVYYCERVLEDININNNVIEFNDLLSVHNTTKVKKKSLKKSI